MTIAIVLIIAYLLGALPTSYIVVNRLTGRDIRTLGDGNPGMMNVWDSVGLLAALIVGVGDSDGVRYRGSVLGTVVDSDRDSVVVVARI